MQLREIQPDLDNYSAHIAYGGIDEHADQDRTLLGKRLTQFMGDFAGGLGINAARRSAIEIQSQHIGAGAGGHQGVVKGAQAAYFDFGHLSLGADC